MIIVNFFGGLGNQMFQYALFKKFQSLGLEVKADITHYEFNNEHNGFELEKVFHLKIERANLNEIKSLKDNSIFLRKYRRFFHIFWKKTDIEQISFDFDGSIFYLKDAYLNGYWQSEKFFKDISPELRKDFSFKNIDKNNKLILNKIIKSNSVSIHIRRGDYVTNPNFNKFHGGICNISYYLKAIELIKRKVKKPVFFIFSDDLDWVKKNLPLLENTIFVDINKGKNSYKDLFLMSKCKHNILANSSFSWWAAWLNSNSDKIIVCPDKWFNSRRLDSKDIVPESWIRLSSE